MNKEEREVLVASQLDNVCNLLDGTLIHQVILNSRAETSRRIVIEYQDPLD